MANRFGDEVQGWVVTVSDRCARGEQEDVSGPAVAEMLRAAGVSRVERVVVPDEVEEIAGVLRRGAAAGVELIVTTGGTGLAARDVTPEATRAVCDRMVDGVAERMRAVSFERTPMAVLSRGVCGILGRTLVLNLPGSPDGARVSLGAVLEVLPHAVDLLVGRTGH
jgi:molybdopterin adenylyltransferase